jgi:hypothetical protein
MNAAPVSLSTRRTADSWNFKSAALPFLSMQTLLDAMPMAKKK